MYNAKILKDSISQTGKRITTFEITFPRIVLAELNTHRMFSRNSASSRAIPVNVMIDRVLANPFIPEKFPASYKGMQPNEYWEKGDYKYKLAEKVWLNACSSAIDYVRQLTADGANGIKVHKQIANRLLEPFMWHTVIVTATEFDNFFRLRTNEQAQYEIRRIADLMYEAYHSNECYGDRFGQCDKIHNHIQKLAVDEWHLPLISEEDTQLIETYTDNISITNLKEIINIKDNPINKRTIEIGLKKQISVARCARVSYLTHDGKRDIEKDLELFERLRTSGHWSPFEHVCTPYFEYSDSANNIQHSEGYQVGWDENKTWIDYRSGNFIGWKQYRKEFQDENCTRFRKGE